jgi:hypothetical protein
MYWYRFQIKWEIEKKKLGEMDEKTVFTTQIKLRIDWSMGVMNDMKQR